MSAFGMVCQKCGAGMPMGIEFCGRCGAKIEDQAAPPAKEDPPRPKPPIVGMLLLTWGLGLVAGFMLGHAIGPSPAVAPSQQAAPESTGALLARARAASAAGRYSEARTLYQSAIIRAPRDLSAHVDLGLTRLALGDEAGARASFTSALKGGNPHPAAAFNLGLLEEEAGNLGAAKSHFTLYLKLAPNGPKADEVRAKIASGGGLADASPGSAP